jgi:L-amino acid N-acyltransferase YncA
MGFEIRAARPADAGEIAAIYAPIVQDSVTSFEESPPDAAELQRRMLAEPRLPWLVAETPDPPCPIAGYAYASVHKRRAAYRWSADVSIYLAPGHRSKGLGRALYQRLFAEVRALGYVSLFAGVTLPNPASVGLHESMGFRPLGVFGQVGFKHGAWRDVGWWQLLLDDPPVPPDEPLPWLPAGDPRPSDPG